MKILTEEIYCVSGKPTQRTKDYILKKLKEYGKRITRQRVVLLDIILEGRCSCCKEVYYEAIKTDSSIGIATVYRMLNLMEEIGVIQRTNSYKIEYHEDVKNKIHCRVKLDDGTSCTLSNQSLNRVLNTGLKLCGYIKNQKVEEVRIYYGDDEKKDSHWKCV